MLRINKTNTHEPNVDSIYFAKSHTERVAWHSIGLVKPRGVDIFGHLQCCFLSQ